MKIGDSPSSAVIKALALIVSAAALMRVGASASYDIPPAHMHHASAKHQTDEESVTVPNELDLFGGAVNWKHSSWVLVDDSFRGGKTYSEWGLADGGKSLLFRGKLEVGADNRAFANLLSTRSNASRFSAAAPWWDLSVWDGVLIKILHADGNKYSLNLRTEQTQLEGEPPIDYKYTFETKENSGSSIYAEWSHFVPTFRGQQLVVEDSNRLDTSRIVSLSITASSFLGQQSGSFELVLEKISAYKKTGNEARHDEL
ncbi:complex I intermediate-associated protein 30-domain-containing protein [Zopfochytrium polystomum]|nr:complex I intermediate-associated protein 30-domain-containing protein [Zopfochytrium polystomum]